MLVLRIVFPLPSRVLVPINPDNAEASPPSSACQVQSGRHICKSTKYRLAPNVLVHTNYQEIKIQENAKALAVGTVPRSICVLLQDDLADTCQTGGMHLTRSVKYCSVSIVEPKRYQTA